MNTDRIIIDAPGAPVRGPWDDPVRSALPAAVHATDPRLALSEQALVVASTNAFPIVARQKTRRDSVGLAAGAAVALVLGCPQIEAIRVVGHRTLPDSLPNTIHGAGAPPRLKSSARRASEGTMVSINA